MGPFSVEFSTNRNKRQIAGTPGDVSSLNSVPVGQSLSWWGLWEPFLLVYQLRIWFKILKVKIFLEPFYMLYRSFFPTKEEEWISGPPLFTCECYISLLREGWGSLAFWRAFSQHSDGSILLLFTPSSTWLLIFISELWNAILLATARSCEY